MRRTARISAVVALAALLVGPTAASERGGSTALSADQTSTADTTDAARQRYLIAFPSTLVYRHYAVSLPGSSINTPTAYGADFRDVFGAAVYQRRTRNGNIPDGALAVGFGLGDARKTAGLEFVITNFNVFTEPDRGEKRDFILSVKIHRQALRNFHVAAGVENAVALRGEMGDSGTSYYAVGSRRFQLRPGRNDPFPTLTASLGLGNGRFRSEHQISRDDGRVNAFGSVGIQMTRAVSFVADWTGQDLNSGISIAPLKQMPFIVTAAFADLTGRAGDGARLIIGAGFAHTF